MSSNVHIVMLLHDVTSKVSVFGDIILPLNMSDTSLSNHSELLTMPRLLSLQSSCAAVTTGSSCTSCHRLCLTSLRMLHLLPSSHMPDSAWMWKSVSDKRVRLSLLLCPDPWSTLCNNASGFTML
jgi:hypothetical protein